MRFTAIVPNEKIEFEAEVGPMRPNCAFIFDQVHGGTSVTFQGDPNPVGPFKLLSPLFTRIGHQVWAGRLARTKTALEAPGILAPAQRHPGGESRVQRVNHTPAKPAA